MPRYLGNMSPTKKEVHDAENPKSQCQLGEIKDKRWFNTLEEAHRAGLDNCAYCLGRSTR